MAAVLTSLKKLWGKLRNDQSGERSPNNRISTAERFSNALSPFESYVVSIQSILIWENPKVSTFAIVISNLLFLWINFVLKLQLYGIIFSSTLCVFLYRTFVFEVWPEIKLPPAEGEDTEEWTAVNPQVFSVPEISRHMDNIVTTLKHWNEWLWSLRSTNPGLFCISGCILFTILAVIGQKVSGIFIVYMIFLTITIGPGVILHVIPRAKLENLLSLLVPNDYSLEHGHELKSFIPDTDSENLAALEIPLKFDDFEPQQKFGNDGTEPKAEPHNFNDSLITPSLTLGLQNFPDPTYENPNNEFLPSESCMASIQHSDTDQMQFVPTHFNSNYADTDSQNANQGFTLVAPKSKQNLFDAVKGDLMYKLSSSIANSAINNIISSTLSGANKSTTSTGYQSKATTSITDLGESEASDDSSGFEIIDEDYEFSDSST